MFFSGMNFVLTYLHYCEDVAPAKLVAAAHKEIRAKLGECFGVRSHFAMLKYLTQVSAPEPHYLAECMLLLYATYAEDFAEWAPRDRLEFWTTMLNLVAFAGKSKNSFSFTRAYAVA